MSFVSLLDEDLAVVYRRMLPVPLFEILSGKGVRLVDVPEEEVDTLGCNVLAVAPRNFGVFSHALLVGNFGDGRINAYDLLTGKHLGHLTTPGGADLVIEGLWGLTFERDEVPERESLFTASRLYFTAGPNGEDDGLIGFIRPVNRLVR